MLSCSSFHNLARDLGRKEPSLDLPVVCVQGLGFVGAAMAVAVAHARNSEGFPIFHVVGVDLPTQEGLARIEAINEGTFPFACEDQKLLVALQQAHQEGNLLATADEFVYALASTVLVDVNLDVVYRDGRHSIDWESFRAAIFSLGRFMPSGCLVIIETTVPPGTCSRLVAPLLSDAAAKRGMAQDAFLLAHAYERVMPGQEYFDSIVNFWRVYSGHTEAAADACERFLSKVIDIRRFPLTRVGSTTASEIGKVLENSYRAVNIAFMEEWGRFAERLNVDLYEVIDAIRIRPTHANLRQPGFGVGGYCLTKDPLMAHIAAQETFGFIDLEFPFCHLAVTKNRVMPLVSLDKIQDIMGGDLSGKTILLLGVSYRQDVGDTRNSPAQTFVEGALARGAHVICHDPYVSYWPEIDIDLATGEVPSPRKVDAIIFALPHKPYLKLDIVKWLEEARPLIFDANNVLTSYQIAALKASGIMTWSIGRGRLA